MRIQLQNDESAIRFSKQLLELGNGKMPANSFTKLITFPSDFCKIAQSVEELINLVFHNIEKNYKNMEWLRERALLAGKNVDVNSINNIILNRISENKKKYKYILYAVTNEEDVVNYSIEFLNSLHLPGFPPHVLELKVGAPIILLRNINPPRLCNGTRLAVKNLMNNLIEATIITGKYKGTDVLLPRIPMITTDMPFAFKRLQFPLRLAFAMTINKSQGQSLQVCGLNLANPWTTLCCMFTRRKTFRFIYLRPGRKDQKYCIS